MAAVAVLLVCSGARLAAQDDVLLKLYADARQAEAAGNYPAAIEQYKRIVQLRPSMAEAHANLGNLY